jgi:hypothetical protein
MNWTIVSVHSSTKAPKEPDFDTIGQKIHNFLMLSDNRKYTPKARPLDGNPNFWEEARTKGLGNGLELDFYEYM